MSVGDGRVRRSASPGFEYLLTRPQALRMSLWRKLERPATGPEQAAVYAEKIEAMTGGQQPRERTARDGPHRADHRAAQCWLVSPDDLLTADGSDPQSPERIAVHRAALVEAARGLCAPGS